MSHYYFVFRNGFGEKNRLIGGVVGVAPVQSKDTADFRYTIRNGDKLTLTQATKDEDQRKVRQLEKKWIMEHREFADLLESIMKGKR